MSQGATDSEMKHLCPIPAVSITAFLIEGISSKQPLTPSPQVCGRMPSHLTDGEQAQPGEGQQLRS